MRIRHFLFSLTKNEPKVVLQQEDENSTEFRLIKLFLNSLTIRYESLY